MVMQLQQKSQCQETVNERACSDRKPILNIPGLSLLSAGSGCRNLEYVNQFSGNLISLIKLRLDAALQRSLRDPNRLLH